MILLAVFAVPNSSKENHGPDLARHESKKDGSSAIPFVDNHPTGYPDKQSTEAKPPHQYPSPEGWLAILGFPTLGFVCWQAFLMRQHAGHLREIGTSAKNNAEAALLQANYLLASERAWLAVTMGADKLPDPPEDNSLLSLIWLAPLVSNSVGPLPTSCICTSNRYSEKALMVGRISPYTRGRRRGRKTMAAGISRGTHSCLQTLQQCQLLSL